MDAVSVTPAQVKSGIAWIAGISLLRDAVQFGVMLALVRLLDPKAFGEYSVVSSVLGLLTVMGFHSFVEHTLQVRPGEEVDYQAHFTFGAFTQLTAVVVLNLAAIGLRQFPTYAPVAPLLSVMSLSFVIDWAAELRVKMLERELNWSRLRLLEAVGVAAGATVSIGLALGGAGVYALLAPAVVALLPFVYDLFVVARWRPTWQLRWRSFEPAWHYGLTRIASGLLARGQQVLESGVLAGIIGLSALGIYGRAMGLASFACLKLMSVMTLTLFPMVTRFLPNSAQFQKASGLVMRAVAWTSIPAAGLLSLAAEPFVRTLYGSRWMAAVPLLPWALAIAALTALMEAAAFLLLANLEPRKTLVLDVLNFAGTGLSLWWLLPGGLVPYLSGLLAVQVLLASIAIIWLVQSGAIEIRAVGQALTGPLIAAAGFGIGAQFGTARSLVSAAMVCAGLGLAYVAMLWVFWRQSFQELLQFVPGFPGRPIHD